MRIRIWAAGAAVCFGSLLTASASQATDYYVSPTGSDSNPGTMAQPFGTVQKAVDAPSPGDTVWFRAGTYKNAKQIRITKSGTSDSQRINFFAYQGEVPVIDFSTYVSSNTASDQPTILITGSWLHFKGLEVANGAVQPSGSHSNDAVRASNTHDNIFELLNIHHNFGPGLFIDGGTGGHLILNCDSHDNYDKNGSQGDGQNGDGFGVHYQMTGPSTVLRGNRAWINSDDGYDLISQEVPVTIENCWAVMNGYADGGSTRPSSGNGNGFKAGSSKTGIRHLLQQNVAWKNGAAGFYANHSSGGNTWLNNTSYMNSVQYNMLASPADDTSMTITLTGALAHKMRNNIGFPNKNTNMGGVDSQFNTWDLGITEASNDFASTMDTGYAGPRQADGSLPNINFMKLAAGSPLIDKGTDVQLPFTGAKPDLGAYEYGLTTNTGTGVGGTTGSGGTGATGGTSGAGGAGTGGKAGSGGGAAGGSTEDRGGASGTGTGGISGVTGSGGAVGTGSGGTLGTGGATASGGSSPGTGGNPTGGTGTPGGESGCSCVIASGGSSAWVPLFALALVPLLRRRRR
ncbi:MAG TPA: right-handed parallel beta-helix repeat-containing protein [Polyangia bacterium]|nr:right-handed parallel beta-helix repeat-containing protein [Polyangia bacterium]